MPVTDPEFFKRFAGRDDGGRRIDRPKRKRQKSPEADIQKSILQYLRLRKVFAWRNNTMGIPLHGKNSGRFRPSSSPGAPDIFAVKDGRLYGIEVKSPTGRLPEAQRAFGEALKGAGAVFCVARSIEDIQAVGL